MREAEFQKQVLQLARLYRWRTAHFRPAMTAKGNWVTAVAGEGKGFPDLVLVRAPRLIFAELKAEKGRTSDDQETWLASLRAVPGLEVYLWRPDDWDELRKVLE